MSYYVPVTNYLFFFFFCSGTRNLVTKSLDTKKCLTVTYSVGLKLSDFARAFSIGHARNTNARPATCAQTVDRILLPLNALVSSVCFAGRACRVVLRKIADTRTK